MKDALAMLADLRRPKLLVRAARIGAVSYTRERDLKRLLGSTDTRLPGPREAVMRLLEEEKTLETTRQEDRGHYNMHRHVDVMIALVGEALMARSFQPTPLRAV